MPRSLRLQPAAEQAAHSQERPEQAAPRVTRVVRDPWRFSKDDSHEPPSEIPGTIQDYVFTNYGKR